MIWPPSGVCLARRSVAFGYRIWPGSSSDHFLCNLSLDPPWSLADFEEWRLSGRYCHRSLGAAVAGTFLVRRFAEFSQSTGYGKEGTPGSFFGRSIACSIFNSLIGTTVLFA